MTYVVGISSGWYNIGKDPNLLGFGPKVGSFAATVGAQFNQVDIDTVLEFIEPDIIDYVNTIKKKMSMDVGLHGEIGHYVAFESAEKVVWDQAHERMIKTMVGASKIKFKYVNWHLSSSEILNRRERELRPFGHTYQVISPEGTPFAEWIEKNIDTPGAKMLRKHILPLEGRIVQEINGEVPDRTTEIANNVAEKLKEILRPKKIKLEQDTRLYDQNTTLLNAVIENHKITKPNENYYNDPNIARGKNELNNEKNRLDVERNHIVTLTRTLENSNRQILLDTEDFFEELKQYDEFKPKDLDEIKKDFENEMFDLWKNTNFAKYIVPIGEIDAYIYTGIYMIGNRDPLWEKIVGSEYMKDHTDSLRAYIEKPSRFNAAVAAKYLQGHFTMKNNPCNNMIGGKSVVEFCEDHDIKLLFECPQSGQGTEGVSRLFHPIHSYHLTKSMNSPVVMQCIDFEQEMGQGTELDKLFDDSYRDDLKREALPKDFGANVYLLHLGAPIPYFGTAHIPIALAERGSDAIYRWIYNLRIRGFDDGIIIFERGGGRGGGGQQSHFQIFEYAIFMLRQMVKYLDQDLPPEKLPPEFFGLDEKNKEIYARQLVLIRDHAWDPLDGLLKIPEEKHTFLGSNAIESGKGQQWDKARFR